MVEYLPFKQKVLGSSPSVPTMKKVKYKFKEIYFDCDCGDRRCGKLYIGDFEDGSFEIGYVKYPNRKKIEGAIYLSDNEVKKLIKLLSNKKL